MRPGLLSLLLLAACTRWAPGPMPQPEEGQPATLPSAHVRLLLDGGQVIELRDALIRGDSIFGTPVSQARWPIDTTAKAIALAQVVRLEVRRPAPAKTAVLVGSVIGMGAFWYAWSRDRRSWGGSVSVPCGLLGEPCPPE